MKLWSSTYTDNHIRKWSPFHPFLSVYCIYTTFCAHLLNGCTGKCVRLSRSLVGFWTHFKSLHFHFIHISTIRIIPNEQSGQLRSFLSSGIQCFALLKSSMRVHNQTVYWMCAQVAPSGECLWGKGPPDRMLAKPWRRLFLAAYTLWEKPGCCCCPAWQSVSYHCCPAWQTVICCIVCKVERFVLTIIKRRLLLLNGLSRVH